MKRAAPKDPNEWVHGNAENDGIEEVPRTILDDADVHSEEPGLDEGSLAGTVEDIYMYIPYVYMKM